MVEEKNGFWIDKNNNSWDITIYTKEQAEKNSNSLINCHDCRNCSYCRDCRNCRNCRDCSYCRDFKSNPQRYVTPKIGSRNSQTTFYWSGKEVQVVCGCFSGSLDEFKNKVKETYGRNKYGVQYLREIKKVKLLIE